MNERLDLLALDKQGSLVIIENKLDDAGRDVTWQALKYASYCASLSHENIGSIYQDFLSRGLYTTLALRKLNGHLMLVVEGVPAFGSWRTMNE